jgi:hypothetical protein
VLEVLIETLFGSAPLSAAADEAFLSLAALATSAIDVGGTERCEVPCDSGLSDLQSDHFAAEQFVAAAPYTSSLLPQVQQEVVGTVKIQKAPPTLTKK